MESVLRQHVNESLDMCVFKNAIFLAERLYAEYPSNENLHVVAKCYQRSGDLGTAYRLLNHHRPFKPEADGMEVEKGSQWKCLYLLGVLCAMTDRYLEAEQILDELASHGDHAGVFYWQGVCGRQLQRRWAGKCFVNSLNQNPYLFVSYEGALQCDNEFEVNPYRSLLQHNHPGYRENAAAAAVNPSSRPGTAPHGHSTHHTHTEGVADRMKRTTSGSSISTGARSSVSSSAVSRHPASPVPIRPTLAAGGDSLRGTGDGSLALLVMLKQLADAAKCLYGYKLTEALTHLNSPQMPQKTSGWVLIASALASFHNGQMPDAANFFSQLRAAEPWRLNDPSLVYYSTALWHLKDEAALAHLSQVVIDAIPMSSIALSIVGNCYSLVREPKAALAMFQRATQADSTHAYAHTVRGYECLANDQREEAEGAFKQAIRYDPRLYTAYAGLGTIAFQEGDDERARQYFLHALKINPLVTIFNWVARTYARENASPEMLREALGYYEKGLQRNPKNFAARHQRASVLMRLSRVEQALEELESLREEQPNEAVIHIELGRCLARLGESSKAVTAFHRAMDLEPRRAPMIKEMLERLAAGKLSDD